MGGYFAFYIGSAIAATVISYIITHRKYNRNEEIAKLQIEIEDVEIEGRAAALKLRNANKSLEKEFEEIKSKIDDNRKDLDYVRARRKKGIKRLNYLKEVLKIREDFNNGY